ncbi:MAG TPA: DUF4403 family protein [Thermoanaerobaculia bacterium]|nr:DUF4403 family protein [Thermoanaerobaculia bacterium]
MEIEIITSNPTITARMKFSRATAAVLVFVSCAGNSATAPPPSSITIAAPPPEISTIVVPIRASLVPLMQQLEANVPKKFADKITESGVNVTYDVTRDPIKLEMIGRGLHATTTARYALQACRPPLPCISCGVKQAKREALIRVHTHLDWDANWRLRSKTTARAADFPKRCEVLFGIDITERFIEPVVNAQLREVAKTIDHNTPMLTNIRGEAQKIWTSLQTPVELAPRTWLVLEPIDLALAPISGTGVNATSTLALRARTRIVIGDKPATTTKPLPALAIADKPTTGLRVPFDLELSYADATRLVNAELAGQTLKDVVVKSVTIAPSTNGRIRVEALVDTKRYDGIVYLEGTPSFDATTNTLALPDLDYTITSRNPFVRLAERATHETLRARLRENARFSLGTRIASIRDEVTRALTRPLAPNVQLRGRVDAIQPVSVTPLSSVISVRVIATGAADVDLKL